MPTLSKPKRSSSSIYFTCGNKSHEVAFKKSKNRRQKIHRCFSEAVRYFGWANRSKISAYIDSTKAIKLFDYYSYHKFIAKI